MRTQAAILWCHSLRHLKGFRKGRMLHDVAPLAMHRRANSYGASSKRMAKERCSVKSFMEAL